MVGHASVSKTKEGVLSFLAHLRGHGNFGTRTFGTSTGGATPTKYAAHVAHLASQEPFHDER